MPKNDPQKPNAVLQYLGFLPSTTEGERSGKGIEGREGQGKGFAGPMLN